MGSSGRDGWRRAQWSAWERGWALCTQGAGPWWQCSVLSAWYGDRTQAAMPAHAGQRLTDSKRVLSVAMADEVLPAEPVDEERSSLLPQAHGGDLPSVDARSELSRGVAPQPEPQSEPGPEPGADFQSSSEDEGLSPRELERLDEELARLDEEPSPLPGAVQPQMVSEMSVMAQRHAAPAKAKVAARRELAQLASESNDIRDQLAERHVFSNVRYAQKVAEKRRARVHLVASNLSSKARRTPAQISTTLILIIT